MLHLFSLQLSEYKVHQGTLLIISNEKLLFFFLLSLIIIWFQAVLATFTDSVISLMQF